MFKKNRMLIIPNIRFFNEKIGEKVRDFKLKKVGFIPKSCI